MTAVESPPASKGRSPLELLKKVSASRLQTFHQCRLKFYFRYSLRLEKSKSPALHVGSAVHFVLQTWNRARWKGEAIDFAILKQMFVSYWVFEQAAKPIDWEDDSEAPEMESAWQLAMAYLEQTPIPPNEKPEAVEVEAEADLSRRGLPTLIGFIDLVRAGGRIVDFKTSAQTPHSERALHYHELQLSCYGVLYRDATGHPESGFELHHLVKLKTPKIVITAAGPMTPAQETKLFRAIESYVAGVQREDWVPNPNPMTCACCEYFTECRQWVGKEGHATAH